MISAETGHSECWRRDKSPVEILELTKLLQGIRKITSLVGRNVGIIEWKGMPTVPSSIILDPSPILGSYPIPASKADIAIGLAVRAAFHQTEWSDHVKKTALARFDFPPTHAYKLNIYIDMAERVYVDMLSNRSVFGLYTEKARKWTIDNAVKQFVSPPTFTELLHIWWEVAADRKFRQDNKDNYVGGFFDKNVLNNNYKNPLSILNKILYKLMTECHSYESVTERCKFRLNLYASVFDELLEHVKEWPGDRKEPYIIPADFQDDIKVKYDDEKDSEDTNATILGYADEIGHNLQGKQTDFTKRVKSIVANSGEVIDVQGNDFVMPSGRHIDNAILYKLKVALLSVSQRRTSNNRGLESGKIDRTRLFRARTTGKIFSQKKIHFELYNDIVFLIDCTGSMADPDKWEKLMETYQTLFMAFLGYNSNARIFAYNERGDTCRITEIFKNGKFFRITPQGKTASGEAIIATALSINKSKRNPFIIHITDGACNWGCGVSDAIRYCKEKKIRLITLGFECYPMNQDALRKEYGELIRFFNNTDDLPGVFKDILRLSVQSDRHYVVNPNR